ncbi:alpha/beta fold hydrolase [Sulfuritalea hydrogenivorans]|jgi:pimeloyl-ACP methyl ester carboxylesterase|uniref:Alpha/beta hydrolase n=1 Tax=Sulfuritalea hydrogenivorans sk43H TaxID=1223802 RepID=W0SHQ9_9PROT|nr:alpha/beta hydrolase [Sulfuritalea hydrogenivorans]MDK9715578.1 alpha/beta hydrolase [Sulfuritalea sp.]BAO29458.1 alpha/beta hydrolase [Sulfuritalea hydrogenivorans sk43H]
MHNGFISASGRTLEYQLIPAHQINRPTLVLLHEGLGSVAMWRDFPAKLAAASGCRTLVYSRYGYGQSDVLQAPFGTDFMHREAGEALPELLAALDITKPVLVGHSDGASIALLHAGDGRFDVEGLVVMAPHCFVEDISIRSIEAAKVAFESTDLPDRLAKYHRDVRRTFYGWNDIWLHPEFRAWNIEDCLAGIRCPILAIQGVDDEYGSMAQIEAIADQATAAADVELMKLADCRHSPHKDQPQAVIDAMVRFVDRLDT